MAKKKIVSKTRRANNEGSVFQRKDGLWVGMASLGYDENGKQKRKAVYGKTKIEVVKKLAELTNRMANDNYDYVNGNTLSGLMLDWLMVFKKPLVTARTFEGIMGKYRLYIAPKMGGMKLDEITPIIIQKFLNQMQENDLSLDYVKKTKFLLRQFFEYAIDNKWVLVNPTLKVKVKGKRNVYEEDNDEKYKALPPEIRDMFLEALNKDEANFIKPLCITLMFAGLRIGEALALKWKNIDFKNKTIKVERAITQVPKFDDEGNVKNRVTVIGDTKTTCSVREIPVTDIVIETLKIWKDKQNERQQTNPDVTAVLTLPTSFVFANDDGSYRTYSGTRKIFDRFKRRNNLDKFNIHFHGLRHTFSNMLFEMNENPKVIQQLLGHRDVKTTITVYNSVNSDYVREVTDRLNAKIQDNQKVKDLTEEEIESLEMSDDEIEERIRELEELQERKRKRKEKDFEM